MKIGIPQALIYWKRPYFWEVFFENLGFEVLLSPKTNKEIIEMGTKISDPETCFSNKVYWGHLFYLQGKCDLIFVPRMKTNEEKLEYCPKLFGIPDVASILVETPILTETFDERKEKFKKTIERLGRKLNKKNVEIKKALKLAFLEEKEIRERDEREFFGKIGSDAKKIIIISHPYNLYDEYVNLRIKEKLEKLGTVSLFIDEVPKGKPKIKKEKADFPEFHWEFGREIMEKTEEILKHNITGVIQISSFACGCDAVLKEFIEQKFKVNKIPFLYLIIDEHAGEAGFQTRLEAFIDTL